MSGGFRGVHAAASLKLGRLARDSWHAGGFPRCARRGLIEASPFPRRDTSGCASFRGVHAAASLKLGIEQDALDGAEAFPRCARRGLIEAASAATSAITASSVSAVCTPRPH